MLHLALSFNATTDVRFVTLSPRTHMESVRTTCASLFGFASPVTVVHRTTDREVSTLAAVNDGDVLDVMPLHKRQRRYASNLIDGLDDEVTRMIFHKSGAADVILKLVHHRWKALVNKPTTVTKMNQAITNCSLLQWAIGNLNGCPWNEKMSVAIALSGNLKVLEWAYDNGCPFDPNICVCAAVTNDIHMITWAHDRGFIVSPDAMCLAAGKGHVDVLIWGHARGWKFGSDVFVHAVLDGQLSVVKWLCTTIEHIEDVYVRPHAETDVHMSVGTFLIMLAAKHGHIPILQWATSSGFEWQDWTWWFAAKMGHIHVLQWARDCGFPWSPLAYDGAHVENQVEVVEWLRRNGCPEA